MSVVHYYTNEIDMIYSDEMKDFVTEALGRVVDDGLVSHDYVKLVVRYGRTMARVMQADDLFFDAITVAALLHTACKFNEHGDEDIIGALRVRSEFTDLIGKIGREEYNMIMYMIESQHGFHSPIPQVEPKLNDPAHLWVLAFACHLAKEDMQ